MPSCVKQYHWSMGHVLANHPDACARPHGHNYVAHVNVGGKINPETSMVLDLHKIDDIIKPIIDRMDHQFVYNPNDTRAEWFRKAGCLSWRGLSGYVNIDEPTAENIARFLFWEMERKLAEKRDHDRHAKDAKTLWVRVDETPKCSVVYGGEE